MGPRMNNRIFAKSVQVISETGQNLGIMPTAQALAMAGDAGLDLVEINANNTPPIVKIMDYGKFKYDQKKRANEARKNQKTVEMKEVWVKPFIEENDLNIKMKKVFEFLDGGNKVKIYSITNSLVELPNINKVQISVNGDTSVSYKENMSLSTVFERNLELVENGG